MNTYINKYLYKLVYKTNRFKKKTKRVLVKTSKLR